MLFNKTWFLYIKLAVMALGLMACQPSKKFATESKDSPIAHSNPNHTDDSSLSKRSTTGFSETPTRTSSSQNSSAPKLVLKYTPSGDSELFDQLASEERNSQFHSPELSQEINDASISLASAENESSTNVTVHIYLNTLNEPLQFFKKLAAGDLNRRNLLHLQKAAQDNYNYQIATYCFDGLCSTMSVTLYRYKDQQLLAQSSFLKSTKKSQVRAQISADAPSDSQSNYIQNLLETNTAEKETVAIVDGRSYSKVKFVDPNDLNKNILEVRTPIVQTDESSIDATHTKIEDDQVQVLDAKLQGSNAITGGLALDVKVQDQSQKKPTRVRLYVQSEQTSQGSLDIDDEALVDEVLQNYNYPVFPLIAEGNNSVLLPKTLAASARLEKYRKHPITQKYVDMWTKKNVSRIGFCSGKKTYYTPERAKKFLTQMTTQVKSGSGKSTTMGNFTSAILNKVDTLPQTAYLAILEGNYVEDFNANIVVPYQKAANLPLKPGTKRYQFRSDASGPYGCLTDTCRELIRNNKQLLSEANLDLQVSYVTPMERNMYDELIKKGIPDEKIKRGSIRHKIYNSGREQEYIRQRDLKVVSLQENDARRYFATATLLAGLVVRENLIESHKEEEANGMLPKGAHIKRKLRKDPALAILAYHSGYSQLATYTVCSQLENKTERKQCQKEMNKMNAVEITSVRHQGFETSLEQVTELRMAPCNELDYTWSWLAIQFIGSNPEAYGIELGTPSIENLVLEDLIPADSRMSHLWQNPGDVENIL